MDNTLLMPFLDQSETYVLGFEAGQIWQLIEDGECLERKLIHIKNIEQMKLICETFGVQPEIETVNDTWAYLTVKSIDPEQLKQQ